MIKIDIDEEVFEILQKYAVPFEDTPNTVLRRLLIGKKKNTGSTLHLTQSTEEDYGPVEKFVSNVQEREFGEKFRKVGRYRMMFESDSYLVYFQNFNQVSSKFWFRINQKPWAQLQASGKKSVICFTNPAEKIAYVIPVADIAEKVRSKGWGRDYLEVNIDRASSRWIDLDWFIENYLKDYA